MHLQILNSGVYRVIVVRQWAQHCVPLNFVCKRLEELLHLTLFRWSGGGPASEGQEATETQLVIPQQQLQPMRC